MARVINNFAAGQRVRIQEGGWGIHPDAEGLQIVLTSAPPKGDIISDEDYLFSAFIPHHTHAGEGPVYFGYHSIEALEDEEEVEQKNPLSVDALLLQIEQKQQELDALKEELHHRVGKYL